MLQKIKRYLFDLGTPLFLLTRLYFVISDIAPQNVWRFETFMRGVKFDFKYPVKMYGRAIIDRAPGSEIIIGKNVILMSDPRRCLSGPLYCPCKISTIYNKASISIGDGVSMNGTSIVSRSTNIVIGRNTMIGPNCIITDSDFHQILPVSKRNNYSSFEVDEGILIGENVWIGSNVIILPGSNIGDNSVVGAGSIVKGTIPPNCVAVGISAKAIKFFRSEE